MLATAALCLLGHLEPSHFAGALTLDDDIPSRPLSEMSRVELTAELEQLDKFKTVFIAPTVITGVGAVLAVIGFVVGIVGVFYAYLGNLPGTAMSGLSVIAAIGYVALGVGGALLVAGGILLAVGLAKLFPALSKRRLAAERREDIQQRLDELDQQGVPSPPPLPVPTPQPGAFNAAPYRGVVVATF